MIPLRCFVVLAMTTACAVASDGVLLHVSFDRSAPGGPVDASARRAAGRPDPWPGLGIELDADGRFGEAVRIDRASPLGYDTAENLRCERGTVAFWFKAHGKPFTWDGTVIAVLGRPVHHYTFPFFRQQFDGRRRSRGWWTQVCNHGGWLRWSADDWPAQQWHHIAIGWDVLIGWRLHVDGELVTKRDGRFWPERILGRLGIGARVSAHTITSAGVMVQSLDELYVFDYLLDTRAIQRLMHENVPLAREPAEPDADAWLAWRCAEVGLSRDIPPLATGAAVNRALFRVPRFAKTVGRRSYLIFDGKKNSVWPLAYQGYATGSDDLHVILQPGPPANWLQLKGDLRGTLSDGERVLAVLSDRGLPERAGHTRWRRIEQPWSGDALHVRRDDGLLDELSLVHLDRTTSPALGDARVLGLVRAADTSDEVHRRYEDRDRTSLTAMATAAPPDEVVLPAGHLLHVHGMPEQEDRSLGSTLWDLTFASLEPGTGVHLALIDPVYAVRTICAFEGRLEVERAGPARLRLWLEHQDTFMRAGRRLWWQVCFDRPVTLALGGPAGSRIHLLPAASGPDAFVWDQAHVMREAYNFVSEGDPSQRSGDPRRDFRALDEILTICEDILHVDPDHDLARAVWYKTGRHRHRWTPEARARHPDLGLDVPPIDPGRAPRWAAVGRAALEALRRHSDFWIDQRQAPNGEFGSGYQDDTDLVGDFVDFALIGDPGGKIARAVDRLNDFVWAHALLDGVNRDGIDMNHAYEEGTSILRINAMLHYGEPTRFERLFGVARFLRDTLTGVNDAGHRHFRSYWFSATSVRTADGYGIDVGSSDFFEPAAYIHWYNAHPGPLDLMRGFADAWLAHDAGDGRFGGRSIAFATDRPSPLNRAGFAGESIMDTLYFLYEQTGDVRYNEVIFNTVPHGRSPTEFKVFAPFTRFASWRRLLAERGVDTGAIDAVLQEKATSGPLRWYVTGDRRHLVDQVEEGYRFMWRQGPMVTWAGLAGDRVSIKHQIPLAYMYLGGIASMTKWSTWWYHAVSWEGADDAVSRFVIEQGADRLKVLVYSFHDEPVDILMRVWRLQAGRYEVRTGFDRDDDGALDGPARVERVDLVRGRGVPLSIAPRAPVLVLLEQVRAAPGVRARPDLAIGDRDVRCEPGSRRLVVTVHNIGAEATPPARAALMHGARTIATADLPPLQAPLDLHPKTATIMFSDVDPQAGLRIHVDADERIAEIDEANNVYVIGRSP